MLLAGLALIASSASTRAAAQTPDTADTGPTIVHLLDYVGVDYPATVSEGKVVDESEYDEQREFVAQAIALLVRLPDNAARPALLEQARRLQAAVDAKAQGADVAAQSDALRWAVVRAYGIAVAPKQAPSMVDAAKLYEARCAACHGHTGRGDGPLAKGMEPAPADFHDAARMRMRSAYGLYNTLTLGVAGTPMRAFKELSDDDRWALALLVAGMRAAPERVQAGQALWQMSKQHAAFGSLKDLVTQTPGDVGARHGAQAEAVQAYLFAHPDALQTAAPAPLAFARAKLDEAVQRLRQGDREAARQLAISAYLEGFELVENGLDNVDTALRKQIEREMMAVRTAIGDGKSADAVAAQVEGVNALLERAQDKLSSEGLSPATAFLGSLLILLREGLEAVLVLAAIVAFVRKTGRRDALAYVHVGWIAALVLGALTWWAARSLIDISGAGRELTEGVTALLASAMLLYVGWWLHTRSHAQAWQHFIRDQVTSALGKGQGEGEGKGTVWAMAMVSFLAVYRELFEVILFYETLWVQAGPAGYSAVLAGIAAAALLLALLAWAILRWSARLAVGPFFSATSWLLALLAVVFAGNGVAALQEAGVLAASPIRFIDVPLLGLHATLQGVLAQLAAVGLVLIGVASARRDANAV